MASTTSGAERYPRCLSIRISEAQHTKLLLTAAAAGRTIVEQVRAICDALPEPPNQKPIAWNQLNRSRRNTGELQQKPPTRR